jgi:MFS family permease
VFVGSRLISQAGDMAAVAALTVHVYATTESAIAVAALFVARVLPRILGLFAGAIGDRLELRRLLITCDLACVRGREKVLGGGQVEVPVGGQ